MIPAIGDRKIASRNRTPVTTEAKPVRPPSRDAGGALDVRRVRADAGRAAATAATESTSSTRPTPGTDPSSFARPASAATPVTVPIVSKKSVSMIAKIVGIAARAAGR